MSLGLVSFTARPSGVREWIQAMWENAQEGVHIEIERIADLGDDRVFIAVVLDGTP